MLPLSSPIVKLKESALLDILKAMLLSLSDGWTPSDDTLAKSMNFIRTFHEMGFKVSTHWRYQ